MAYVQVEDQWAIQCEFCDEMLVDEECQIVTKPTTKLIYQASRADGWRGVLCGDRKIRAACEGCLAEMKD